MEGTGVFFSYFDGKNSSQSLTVKSSHLIMDNILVINVAGEVFPVTVYFHPPLFLFHFPSQVAIKSTL